MLLLVLALLMCGASAAPSKALRTSMQVWEVWERCGENMGAVGSGVYLLTLSHTPWHAQEIWSMDGNISSSDIQQLRWVHTVTCVALSAARPAHNTSPHFPTLSHTWSTLHAACCAQG